jgi:hypothetical protein
VTDQGFPDATLGIFRKVCGHSPLERPGSYQIVTSLAAKMKETDYRAIEVALAATLRVFLESKQKLTSFERTSRDTLLALLANVVRRRVAVQPNESHAVHEG